MHPNTYLQTFWRMEFEHQVFVAMSFAEEYEERWRKVIQPAIETTEVDGERLTAYRVDNSQTGDSILTDIMDGIAHSKLILADLSCVGKDKESGYGYRNGNVMYEVGLALACRQPHEVLLLRDDNERFLFDVSTIPHMQIDFTATDAVATLRGKLIQRLRERRHMTDARVRIALASLTAQELEVLKLVDGQEDSDGLVIYGAKPNTVDFTGMVAYPALLSKGILRVVGETPLGTPGYSLTGLGRTVAKMANSMPKLQMTIPTPKQEPPQVPQGSAAKPPQ